ncbi:hypothetical protein OUZ56_016287 [Daphnia magna]|uniref:Uncharacterized protein n=1 Tax=Daphnia magna TaxID=35525 RepID=A0ABR0AQ81_9CRUS|nr:hypothetical protein OUZ56_016287 [Daphnia magna]
MDVKYSTGNDTAFRIRDPIKQLDFIYSMINSSVCGGGNLTAYHLVLGIDRIVIVVREAAKGTDLVEMRPNNPEAVTKMALSELTRAEIVYASHTQYIRDFAMDISNHLAREIRNLQCESRKTAYHAATMTAQYDGWLSAKHLDLPLCTKLLAVGASVSVLQGFPSNVTFETVFKPCETQPRWGNQTINVEGWELTNWLTPPQSAHRNIKSKPQATTNLAPTAPVTIVNIPPPPTPAGPTRQLGPTTIPHPTHFTFPLQPSPLTSSDDREDQKGGQAAWIPDPDEEDNLYCADYSSDMEKFRYVVACPDDEEDILYCADNPDDDEVMYDADVSGDIDDVSLLSVDDPWEEDSFSSGTSTLLLDPVALLEDRPSSYCMSAASDVQERGIDIAALNDSITRLRGGKCNISFVSSHYSLNSDEEDLAAARYAERIYRLPPQKEPEYGWEIGELDKSGNHSWISREELWPRSSTPRDRGKTAEE